MKKRPWEGKKVGAASRLWQGGDGLVFMAGRWR